MLIRGTLLIKIAAPFPENSWIPLNTILKQYKVYMKNNKITSNTGFKQTLQVNCLSW
jgi:hypothetical protein